MNNIQHRKAFLPLIGFILDIVGIGMGFFFLIYLLFFFSGGAAFMDLDKYVERNFLSVFSRLHSAYVYLPLQFESRHKNDRYPKLPTGISHKSIKFFKA